jgi:hypothetical protein
MPINFLVTMMTPSRADAASLGSDRESMMLSSDERSQAQPNIHSAFRIHRRASWGSNQDDWTFPIRGLRYLYPVVPTVILDPIDGD